MQNYNSEFKHIGYQLACLRRKAGLTQEQTIARIEDMGEKAPSLATLRRLESGKGHLNLVILYKICKVFDNTIQDLLDDDQEMQYLYQELDMLYTEEPELQEYILHIKKRFYPTGSDSSDNLAKVIQTLFTFIIILPLAKRKKLYDMLNSIDGKIFGREEYVIKLVQMLINSIPQSDAKKYVLNEASKITPKFFISYYTDTMENEMSGQMSMEDADSYYDAYIEQVNYKYEEAKLEQEYKELSFRNSLLSEEIINSINRRNY